MKRFRVIPDCPKRIIRSLHLCPTICNEDDVSDTIEYYRINFGVTKCCVYSI